MSYDIETLLAEQVNSFTEFKTVNESIEAGFPEKVKLYEHPRLDAVSYKDALYHAWKGGHSNSINYLMVHFTHDDRDSDTMLFGAFENGSPEIIQLAKSYCVRESYLKYFVTSNIKADRPISIEDLDKFLEESILDRETFCPFFSTAIEKNRVDVVRHICEKDNLLMRDYYLRIAFKYGSEEMAKLIDDHVHISVHEKLYTAIAASNATYIEKYTPLFNQDPRPKFNLFRHACFSNNTEMLRRYHITSQEFEVLKKEYLVVESLCYRRDMNSLRYIFDHYQNQLTIYDFVYHSKEIAELVISSLELPNKRVFLIGFHKLRVVSADALTLFLDQYNDISYLEAYHMIMYMGNGGLPSMLNLDLLECIIVKKQINLSEETWFTICRKRFEYELYEINTAIYFLSKKLSYYQIERSMLGHPFYTREKTQMYLLSVERLLSSFPNVEAKDFVRSDY